MDPFAAADPNSTGPAPPPYLSPVEYNEKIADALQRSLVLEDLRDNRPNSRQRLSTISPILQQTARQSPRPPAPLASPPGTANTVDSRTSFSSGPRSSSSHHRQNSISSSSNGTTSSYGSSRHSKERPSWYNEAGLGGRSSGRLYVSSPATMSNGTSASGPSSQPTSPADEGAYPRRYLPGMPDDEAGIDNPPPPFQAALTAPTPPSLTPARTTPSARSSYDTVTSSSTYPNATASSTSPRTSYEGPAAPRLSAPQSQYGQPHGGPRGSYSTAPSTIPPEPRRRRGSSSTSSSYNAAVGGFAASLSGAGPVPAATRPTNGPQLVVDKALAYGKTSQPSLPQGAAPPAATAFYGSAVSSILQAQTQAPTVPAQPPSSTGYNNAYSPSRPVSQRDSTSLSMNSPNSYTYPASTATSSSASTYTQSEPWRPPSAQSYMTNNSAPAGRPSLGPRQMSRESLVTTFSAPVGGPHPHSRSSSSYSGPGAPVARPPSSTDQRASYPLYPPQPPAPSTDEWNPFAAAGGPTSQKRQSSSAYYPAVVSAGGPPPSAAAAATMTTTPGIAGTSWMPPGAARPANVYGRRFG